MALLGSGEEEAIELSWKKQLIGGVALGGSSLPGPSLISTPGPWWVLLCFISRTIVLQLLQSNTVDPKPVRAAITVV